MRGYVSNEIDVALPANDVWAVYSSPELLKVLLGLKPPVFEKLEVVEGDGGVGTILHMVVAAGTLPGLRSWKEKFMKIDNETQTKVTHMIEGGYLDLGFNIFEISFKIIEKKTCSCIIKSSVAFEVDDKFSSNASLITADFLLWMAKAVAGYATQKKNTC